MKSLQKDWQGYCLLLLAQLMVGISIVGSKSLLQNTPAIIILTIRFCIAFLFLLGMHLISSKKKFTPLKTLTKIDWIYIVAQALCAGGLFNIFLLLGLQYTSASVAGIITSVLPAIIVIFSILFLKERITFYTALCVVFAVTGLIIINIQNLQLANSKQIYGDIIIFLSLIPEATYYILAKIHKNKLPVFLVSALMNAINIPFFLLFLVFHHQGILPVISFEQILLLCVVGMASGLFYVFWFLGCTNIQGSMAGLTTAFMPIATLIIAYIFLQEKISVVQFFGMILVIISIFFNASKQQKQS